MNGIAVVAGGMVTAVGYNWPASCAAMRARIRNVRETNIWDPDSGEYLATGKVNLPHWSASVTKLADLVAPAILECLEAAPRIPVKDVPILVGTTAFDRPFRMRELDSTLLPEIADRLGSDLHRASRLVSRGHVSVAAGLVEAQRLVEEKVAPCVVVASVDSLLSRELADHYLSGRRLLTAANSNGFSLGEAGAAVLVARADERWPQLQVLGIGMAREHATIESDEPLRGNGLTDAIRSALQEAHLTIHDVQYRITDINGEHYKFKEMVLSMIRFERKPKPKLFDLWHPIEYIGDVGAAIGAVVLGVALHAGHKGYGIGPVSLCTFGNDDGERAAVVLRYGFPGEHV